MTDVQLSFASVTARDADLIRTWLRKPHVQLYFHGPGLQNTLDDLDKWIAGDDPFWQHWIARADGQRFGYLMTSAIDPSEPGDYAQWLDDKLAITLDLLIGEESFLGRGLSCRMIQEFLVSQFPDITWVYIDPAVANERAVHVYEKAGFTKLGQFIASWHPVPHWMMRLNVDALRARKAT